MNEEKVILTERRGRILLVTFNNPDVLNALTDELQDKYALVLDELERDETIDIVILTGTGKAFVAGADIKGMLKMNPKSAEASAWKIENLYLRMTKMGKIFIAAVNGFALGGGLETAMACDLRIASDRARFGLPEVGLGILPGGGGTQRLIRYVGLGKAKELIYTGRVIAADEAEKIGLVNLVTIPENLLEAAFEMAGQILKNSMVGVRACKSLIDLGAQAGLEKGLAFEKAMFGLCFAQADQREGMTAFVEKRPPIYRQYPYVRKGKT